MAREKQTFGGRLPRLALSLVAALVVALAAGLLPGVTATAYADTYYADYMPTAQDNADALAAKKVTFNDVEWYVIKDESSAADEGNVTLLATSCVATSKFHDSSNAYGTSAVKGVLDGLTAEGGSFAGVADAIVATDLTDVGVTGAKLWLLSTQEAQDLPSNEVRKSCDNKEWWLRSAGSAGFVMYVGSSGNTPGYISDSVIDVLGVRPALKLDLTKVVFNETAKEFTPLVAVTGVKLDKATATVEASKTVKLTATVEPADATDKTVSWTSSDEKVATVKDGTVTAVAAGKATITASAGGKTAACEVTVTEPSEPEPVITAAVAKVARPSAVGAAASRSFKVTWKAAKGAKKYQVQWRAAGGKWQSAVTTKGTSYVVKGLKTGTAYELRVRGVNGSTRGAWSTPARRWLKSASKVRATAGKQSGTVKVTWAKDAKANAGHRVYVYAKQGGKAVKVVEVARGKTSVTIKGLKAGKTYQVRMRPMRKASGSTFSGLICGYRAVKAAK